MDGVRIYIFKGDNMLNGMSLNEIKYQLALVIEDMTMDVLLFEDGFCQDGSPYQIYIEADYNRYFSMEMRLNEDLKEEDHEKEMERAIDYCVNNFIALDYDFFEFISKEIKQSKNKGIIYWQGENIPPELYFESVSYKGTPTLYIFHRTGRNTFLINSIKKIMEGNKPIICYNNTNDDEAMAVLKNLIEREVPEYKGDECVKIINRQ
jgi:hypothetical protein